MALKFDDLVFEHASCCGSHAVARHVDSTGSEWYFRRSPDNSFCVMKITGGRLDGDVKNGLDQDTVDGILKKII